MTAYAPRDPAAVCPFRITRSVMRQRWEALTFLHWGYQPAVVQRLLPPGLAVETAEDQAWVGLVPFRMRVSLPRTPYLPWLSVFCETNVRTYVRDERGRTGIWFFSLDAARSPAVVTARLSFGLPYFWSAMTLDEVGDRVDYRCRRRGPGRPSSAVTVRVGAPYLPTELGAFDHFLSARWRLFSRYAGRLTTVLAEHPPWPLHRAEAVSVDDRLVTATGLPPPSGEPLVHHSRGVDVRIGLPAQATPGAAAR